MSKSVPQARIVDAILDGIGDAERNYEKWSGGEILASTAEHVMYDFIARALMKIPGQNIFRSSQDVKIPLRQPAGKEGGNYLKQFERVDI